uniref:NADH-ubiquinone oxidoreductase chain 2 n=1 Tax=Pseudolycoriella sp. XQM-2020 TaxID=2715250 RepID=A0A6G7GC55_9DIPT|nr:NADH dehydrogenase subunit 2 [Pseudolycoriella sp. XQM-2020]
MLKNLSTALFFIMMLTGSIIAISANSWMSVWMGLEINLLSFIPMLIFKNNLNNSEAALNYFLIQAFASIMILFSMTLFLMNYNLFSNQLSYEFYFNNLSMNLIYLTLMLKLGAAPFHFWFPNVMENISWMNCLILMTWQKLAPMMVVSYLINFNNFYIMFILLSTFIGSVGGLNQTSIRKLISFSSINHIGWMLTALMFNELIWFIYFFIYTLLNSAVIFIMKMFQIFYLNQMYSILMNSYLIKFTLLTSILSLGGLPPFLGFLPKWLIIQSLVSMKMNFLTLFLIITSLITLFYYLKISFSSLMLVMEELNWMFKSFYKNSSKYFLMIMNLLTLTGLFLFIDLIYLI